MEKAIGLALKGGVNVNPNPQVGCVITRDGTIVGTGYHEFFGGPHAEVNAFIDLGEGNESTDLEVYVTLEPCAHYGKTPPCAELLISKKPSKVYVATLDPNPLVAGKGVRMLRDAGIEVEVGLLQEKAQLINRRFFVLHEGKRPYVVLKWAETADGFVARNDYSSKWISGSQARDIVHLWRGEESAILVGANTAYYDNPQLNNRSGVGPDPIRVILDWNLKVPASHEVYDQKQRTIVYNGEKSMCSGVVEHVKLKLKNNSVEELLGDLKSRGVQSVFVEGGAWLLGELLEKGLWDEARVFKSQVEFLQGVEAPVVREKLIDSQTIGSDVLHLYVRE
jgi:diaminohydroxyphosphoribosylaminopyrimidine deaminase/5-amino-6-(5-phosphoribosylamino)uracil reductase